MNSPENLRENLERTFITITDVVGAEDHELAGNCTRGEGVEVLIAPYKDPENRDPNDTTPDAPVFLNRGEIYVEVKLPTVHAFRKYDKIIQRHQAARAKAQARAAKRG